MCRETAMNKPADQPFRQDRCQMSRNTPCLADAAGAPSPVHRLLPTWLRLYHTSAADESSANCKARSKLPKHMSYLGNTCNHDDPSQQLVRTREVTSEVIWTLTTSDAWLWLLPCMHEQKVLTPAPASGQHHVKSTHCEE